MKKSKIIIPAAAILALSVGASVTGTVAWFTASRRTSASLSNLAVMNTGGALGFTVSDNDLVGAKKENSDSVSLTYLKDASYDAAADKVYAANLNADGTMVTGTREVSKTSKSSVTISGAAKDVYFINQFKGTFTSTSDQSNYLMFDTSDTASYIAETTGSSESADISVAFKALRVSMVNSSADDKHTVIWAPYTNETNVYYVKKAGNLTDAQDAESAATEAGYVASNLAAEYTDAVKKNSTTPFGDGSSIASINAAHILLSTKLSTAVSPEITFTVWFEGLDADCINDSTGVSNATSQIAKKLVMSFYAVDSSTLVA
ncbi:MAG: hypothetical protein SOY58_02015 [Candidatus Onthovivens sp.]|nr:hypothetical protein [Candidatus Onthovivens sp.]